MNTHAHKNRAEKDEPTTPDEAENTADTMRVANDDTAGPRPKDLTTQEVRQGHTGDHVRYILAASITGIVVIFAVVYLYFVR